VRSAEYIAAYMVLSSVGKKGSRTRKMPFGKGRVERMLKAKRFIYGNRTGSGFLIGTGVLYLSPDLVQGSQASDGCDCLRLAA
jgi:hypothetical protein